MKTKSSEKFYYRISECKYIICGLDVLPAGDRTIDIKFNDLANNRELLDLLHLYYMNGCMINKYNYESRARWFAGYLSSFGTDNSKKFKKMITNPIVRILLIDDELYNAVALLLSTSINIKQS